MQFSGFIDIAVTLVAAFVLTSLLCTTINELATTLLKTRANTLHRTVSALLDDETVRKAFFETGLMKSLSVGSSSGKDGAKPSYIDGRSFADALLTAMAPGSGLPGLDQLQRTVGTMQDGKLKETLQLAMASAQAGATSVRDEIAGWFDGAMDRLSGYYTRYMKWFSLGVGLVVAVGLNVDAIELTKASWNERVRVAALELADNYDPAQYGPCDAEEGKIACLIGNLAGTSEELGKLPVGWGGLPEQSKRDAFYWMSKVVGWLITALAASVGAPFWFDILQNVMSLRGAGKKAEDSTSK